MKVEVSSSEPMCFIFVKLGTNMFVPNPGEMKVGESLWLTGQPIELIQGAPVSLTEPDSKKNRRKREKQNIRWGGDAGKMTQ